MGTTPTLDPFNNATLAKKLRGQFWGNLEKGDARCPIQGVKKIVTSSGEIASVDKVSAGGWVRGGVLGLFEEFIVEPGRENGKGLFRSFAATAAPYWVHWWTSIAWLQSAPANQKMPKTSDGAGSLVDLLMKGQSRIALQKERKDIAKIKYTRERLYKDGIYIQAALGAAIAQTWVVAGVNPAPITPIGLAGVTEEITDGSELVPSRVIPYWVDLEAGNIVPNSISDVDSDGGGRLQVFMTNTIPAARAATAMAQASVKGVNIDVPFIGRGLAMGKLTAGEPVEVDSEVEDEEVA
jgi:hypothetical protein